MLEIWTVMGVKMAVTHFVTQFGVHSRKLKKIFRENCLENVVSDLKEKWPTCPKKLLLEKSAKNKKIKNAKL